MAKVSSDSKFEATSRVREALRHLGLTTSPPGKSEGLCELELDLDETPRRIVDMWLEFTEGVRTDKPDIAAFDSDHEQMLVLKGIDFTSLCAHHFIPFRGKVHIGYIPDSYVIGISKPARIVDHFSQRPQTQELLTKQIAEYLMEKLQPRGVMVIVEAEHMCVSCRGVKKPGSTFVTSVVKGVFLKDLGAKQEFLALLGAGRG